MAPSFTSPTTRRPERISATMVSGILAHKSKKERLKPLFFYARQFPCSTIGRSGLTAPSFTSFGRLFFWPPQLAGLERAEMNRWPLRTSRYGGTFRTRHDVRLASVMCWWSQAVAATLYLRGKRWSVGWNGDFVEGLLRQRRRSYGIAGSVGGR